MTNEGTQVFVPSKVTRQDVHFTQALATCRELGAAVTAAVSCKPQRQRLSDKEDDKSDVQPQYSPRFHVVDSILVSPVGHCSCPLSWLSPVLVCVFGLRR